MTKRDQLTAERLDALIDVLEQAGLIDEDLNAQISHTRELGEARDVVERANPSDRASEVSPVHSGGGGGPND